MRKESFQLDSVTQEGERTQVKMRLGILGIDGYQMIRLTLGLGKSLVSLLEVNFHIAF